jgi:hypothetical protein
VGEWLAALEGTGLAQALRHSVWVYPLVNAAHLLGVALLLGAIIPLDLRLLGAWPSVPVSPLWRVLTQTATVGLLLAVTFGALLFITRASEYVASGLFLTKMLVVAAATVNAVALRVIVEQSELSRLGTERGKLPSYVRIAGGVSLFAWLAALVLGRLIGYF